MGNKPHSAVVEYQQVLQQLTPDSIDSLAGYFSLAGAVPSSTSNTETLELSKKSFLNHMASYLEETSWPKSMLERLFAVADLTNNGSLRFEDYMSLLYIMGPGSKEEKLQLVFRLYDLDASGYVTKKHLTKMLSISTGMDQLKVSSWKVAVVKYDHMKGTVRDTKQKLSKSDLSSISDPMVDSAMAFYDRDNDGKLNYKEWSQFAMDSLEIELLLNTLDSPTKMNVPWSGLILRDGIEQVVGGVYRA
jgi:Ca2+-binding EF-hand superfamily protein